MNWFNNEFYRLADELAAELARVKAQWGEEIVRRRLRLWRFHGLDLPDGSTINTISFQAYVPADRWWHWDVVDATWSDDRQCVLVEVKDNGEPLPPTNGALSVGVDRDGWGDYGEGYEVTYE